jgi:7,8-dihydropterin-6-yl-methyl-4-(beta-D-ribofuranosyl)aminobenzene 5'-phosphate synthase
MSGVRFKKLFLGLVVAVVAIVLAGLAVPVVQLQIGKRRAAGEIARAGAPRKLSPFGAVERLSVLPLSDLEAESAALKTEPGVAYLIKADNLNILFDLGRNGGREHPSPVLHNMRALGVDPAVIDMLFFSLKTAVAAPPDEPSPSPASVCSSGICHPLGEMRRS